MAQLSPLELSAAALQVAAPNAKAQRIDTGSDALGRYAPSHPAHHNRFNGAPSACQLTAWHPLLDSSPDPKLGAMSCCT